MQKLREFFARSVDHRGNRLRFARLCCVALPVELGEEEEKRHYVSSVHHHDAPREALAPGNQEQDKGDQELARVGEIVPLCRVECRRTLLGFTTKSRQYILVHE